MKKSTHTWPSRFIFSARSADDDDDDDDDDDTITSLRNPIRKWHALLTCALSGWGVQDARQNMITYGIEGWIFSARTSVAGSFFFVISRESQTHSDFLESWRLVGKTFFFLTNVLMPAFELRKYIVCCVDNLHFIFSREPPASFS